MIEKTNCINTRPHAAHPYRSVDRSVKECPGVKNTRYDAVYACPCECNSGGFCGGCGHAGCGRR